MNSSVLIYHALSGDRQKNKYTFDKLSFCEQLEILHNNNYKCLMANDYYQYLVNPSQPLPNKSILITFDDGYESDYTIALPLLIEYNFKATFFVTTDWIGKPGYVTAEQLRIMNKEGMSIQSHAKTHSFLDEMSRREIYHELEYSKKILEDILGDRVSFISFPGGRYNKDVIGCAQERQYSALFSSKPFSIKMSNDICLIGRYCMKQPMLRDDFEKIVSMNVYTKIRAFSFYYLKQFIKKVFGNNNYYIFWKKTGKFVE